MAKRKVNIKKIESKTISECVNAEQAFRRHKAFCKMYGKKPQTREVFLADFLGHQAPKIQQIKQVIAKFNDREAPIMNSMCLEFRRLFSLRQNFVDTTKFSDSLTSKEWFLFYNHSCECDSCSRYVVLHQYDSPIATELKSEVSQAEFDKSLDELFATLKPKGDPIEEMEKRHNFKRGCLECGTNLVNGKCIRCQPQK